MRAYTDGALGRAFRARWDGSVSPWPLALFRVGLAAIVFARTNDWLAPLVHMDHHRWVTGVEYAPSVERIAAPALWSPLFAGVPRLSGAWLELAAQARPWLALLLLCGVHPRITAALLALLGYGLMAMDRYRYFHHLHLLWTSCALLALCPSHARLSLSGWIAAARSKSPRPARVARWPVQLLRWSALLVYAAAGSAKLDADFLSGRTLAAFERFDLLGGALYAHGRELLGHAGLASSAAAAELLLVPLLAIPRLRLAGVALGILLHTALSASMLVSTFSLQMALYLMLFLPFTERRASVEGQSP